MHDGNLKNSLQPIKMLSNLMRWIIIHLGFFFFFFLGGGGGGWGGVKYFMFDTHAMPLVA